MVLHQKVNIKVLSIQTKSFFLRRFYISEKAIKYKEEGNHYFKSQKYKVALLSYHEALKQNFEDNDLYSILYSNCAAAEFHLKNYRTAFKHCVESRKRKTDNIKAIIKGAECCLELNLYDEGIKWCDKGLLVSFCKFINYIIFVIDVS